MKNNKNACHFPKQTAHTLACFLQEYLNSSDECLFNIMKWGGTMGVEEKYSNIFLHV